MEFDAVGFAKEYVRVTSALKKEGVPDNQARLTARHVATALYLPFSCMECGEILQCPNCDGIL